MSVSDSSTCLRAHVDAVFDPLYEQLFAALDLLLVHRARPRPDSARVRQLRNVLEARLTELDSRDRSVPSEAPPADRGEVAGRGARRWPQ